MSSILRAHQAVFHALFFHLFLASKQIINEHFVNARHCERIKEVAMDGLLETTNSFKRFNQHSLLWIFIQSGSIMLTFNGQHSQHEFHLYSWQFKKTWWSGISDLGDIWNIWVRWWWLGGKGNGEEGDSSQYSSNHTI